MLLILGDFDYEDDPDAWWQMLDAHLGADFPVFAVVGNHDEDEWPSYRQKLTTRLARIEGASCAGDYGVKAACTYRGLFFILSGVGTMGSGHEAYIRDRLAASDSIWKVCAWHKNQEATQVGDKGNSVGWEAYEACREGGAIIANGHEHSYHRTKTLSDMSEQRVNQSWPSPNDLLVDDGSTFAFVSGLGGNSIRDQERCKPERPPYGCRGEWAFIYTSDQDAAFGALFIDFGVNGDPYKATGYFKNVAGQVVDRFSITTVQD
jgi:hypothetical protein